MNDEMKLIDLDNIFNTIEENIKNGGYQNREELSKMFENLKNRNVEYTELLSNKEAELLGLYDSLNPTNINPQSNVNYEVLLANIEKRIENGEFSSKEALVDYLTEIKSNGIPDDVLTVERITEFLNKYDELNKTNESPLDMENYKNISLEDQELIASKKTDTILVTDSQQQMNEEFKSVQNELTAESNDGLANADNVFEEMQNNQKEELNFVNLSDFNYGQVEDAEVLKRISFFLSNSNINPYEYKINPKNGYFYNIETQEIYEVRKNEQTGKYEIYRGGEKMYTETNEEMETNQEQTTTEPVEETPEEEMTQEKSDTKVKRLVKPPEHRELDNAAFVNIKGIIILIATIIITVAIMASYLLIQK